MSYATAEILKEFTEFNKVVEINKNKIAKGQIKTQNLRLARSNFETLRDIVNGSLAEFVALRELKSVIMSKRPDLMLLEYESLRNDDGAYPDLFDAILCKKTDYFILHNNIGIIINEYTKLCNASDGKKNEIFSHNKEAIKKIKEMPLDFKTIEIKSSKVNNLESGPENLPFIAYIKDKNIFKWEDSSKTAPVGFLQKELKPIAENSKGMVFFSKNEYLNACFPNAAMSEREKLYFKSSATLKDVHLQIFFTPPPQINKEDCQLKFSVDTKIDLENFKKTLSQNFSKSKCASWEEIVSGDYIGTTSRSMNTLYHLRSPNQPKIGCSVEDFILKSFILQNSVTPVQSHCAYSSKEEIIEELENKNNIYKTLPDKFKNELEILTAALKLDGKNICYAPLKFRNESFRANIYAIEQTPLALEVVANKYKDNKEIVSAAVIRDPRSLVFASSRLRSDKKFILGLLNQRVNCLEYVSKEIIEKLNGQSDKEAYFRSWCEKEDLSELTGACEPIVEKKGFHR